MANGTATAPHGIPQIFKCIVVGSITGAIESVLTYPAEYIKTQLQLDRKGTTNQYKLTVNCVRHTVERYGFFGLYHGLSVVLYGSVPQIGVRFGAYEFFHERFVARKEDYFSNSGKLLCGLGAGVCEALAVGIFMETIRIQLINDQRRETPKFRGSLHGLRTIIKTQGIRGIYKGVTATILTEGSNQAIRFFVMENLKEWYRGGDPNKTVPTLLVGAFGVTAGAASVFTNTPLDVVKTRMQSLGAAKYKSTLDCFIQILRREGAPAFYKGILARVGNVCLDAGFTFMIYDACMNVIGEVLPH